MNRTRILLLASAAALFAPPGANGEELRGRVVDAQTGEPIARARVAIHVVPKDSQPADLILLTDVAGTFGVKNLPDGAAQLSYSKPGYLNGNATAPPNTSSAVEKQAPIVIRLVRQAVIEGSILDDSGTGVPFASVQLFRYGIVDGLRHIQPVNGAQADESGEFRIFGLSAGGYFVGAKAQSQPLRNSKKLVYAPTFYPEASEINGAQLIALQPGTEEHVRIRVRTVPGRQLRGRLTSGQNGGIFLRPQEPDRIPLAPDANWTWDPAGGGFTASGVPAGAYVVEATTQIDGQQRRFMKAVIVDDTDLEGIVLEPVPLRELTGRVTVDGVAASRQDVGYIGLRSSGNSVGAQLEEDGSFRFRALPPDYYHVSVSSGGSRYVRSIRQGGRDVQWTAIEIGEPPPDPLEIELSSGGATLEGIVPDSGSFTPIVVALFRRVGDEFIFEKQAFANGALVPINGRPAQFSMQCIAPGEYVVVAWPSDAEIEYAKPGFLRQYAAFGKTIQVGEGARLTVVLDRLLR
jgi:hypothetical protein